MTNRRQPYDRSSFPSGSGPGGTTLPVTMFYPETYGASRNGVTNDGTAFTAMVAAMTASIAAGNGARAILSTGTYLVNPAALLNLPAGSSLVGQGFGSILKTTANQTLLQVGGQNVYLANFKIEGSGAGGAQDGIDIGAFPAGPGFENTIVENVWLQSLGNAGIFLAGGGDAFQHGPLITSCVVDNCGFAGIWNFFEYSRIEACSLKGNAIGIRMQGGNQIVANSTICNGTTGIQIVGGGNDGHGMIVGCEINHNTTNVHSFNSLANGMPIVGCNIYGTNTNINLVSSVGVRFLNCAIDVTEYIFDGSQETVFQNCLFPAVETNTITNNANAHASHTIWGPENVTLVSQGSQLAFTFAADANQTLTFTQSMRRYVIVADGVISATRSITSRIAPAIGQTVVVRNNNIRSVTWLWATGTGITLAPNTSALIGSDGTNAILIQAGT